MENHRLFYHLLGNTLIATIANNFVWFALTFWVFLETKSVIATSYVAGSFAILTMVSALFFGTIVDHQRKQVAMVLSSVVSLTCYGIASLIFLLAPSGSLTLITSPYLWACIVVLLMGSVAGNLRMIALTTSVSLLFTESRDKMNGLVGSMNGIAFAITSILSGLAIGFLGMGWSLALALVVTSFALIHIACIRFPEASPTPSINQPKARIDVRGTIAAIREVPGMFALIFYTTFNNFLGGVFMALMDAYGLSLLSVEAWGIMLALMSGGFIIGGLFIARFGLSPNPLRRMLIVNVINWITCIAFVIQPSVILLGIGMLIWMTLFPFIEASEQTVIQKVIPYDRQGRVLGFAQSLESAATPVTAFLIGPIAQWLFIPFMTTGAGVALIGDWFGTGPARGIALVFIAAGLVGLLVTLLAFRSRAYHRLSEHFL